MTTLVLLILGAVWAAVLIPPALRARAEASPGDAIGHFHHQLNVLRRTGGYAPVPIVGEDGPKAPPRMRPVGPIQPSYSRYSLARKRRRDILVTLLWLMAGTLALGLLPPFRGLLLLHLAVDMLFAGYVFLLLQMKKAAAPAVAVAPKNVARFGERPRSPRPVPPGVTDLALRRAAGN